MKKVINSSVQESNSAEKLLKEEKLLGENKMNKEEKLFNFALELIESLDEYVPGDVYSDIIRILKQFYDEEIINSK